MSKPKSGVYWKATKTYDGYIEIFKFACEELGRSITPSELDKHKFNLPSVKWLIKNCPNQNIKTLNDLLELLGYKPIKGHNKHRKYTYEIAREEFEKRGLILPLQEYTSSAIPLMYICPKHPDIIQYKSLNSLLSGKFGKWNGCRLCYLDINVGSGHVTWKGGISSLNVYLRECIDQWKKNSMANCNYKCAITGEKFDDIHHLYSFNKILREIIKECKLPVYTVINDYTEEELILLQKINIKIHNKYPLGVCISKKIHNLYHHLYGDDNTPEQFEEFKIRYNIGEFKDYNFPEESKRKQKVVNLNGRKEFNSKQLVEIRNKYTNDNCTEMELAEEYEVSKTVINNIVNFKRIYGYIVVDDN